MKRTHKDSNTLHPIQDFDMLIRRERARADRSGSEFSLVVYPLEHGPRPQRILRTLEEALRRRVRSIDEIGWFQEGVLGVLLPTTGPEGAQTFAESFAHGLNGSGESLRWQVFTYPSHWYHGGDSGAAGTRGDSHRQTGRSQRRDGGGSPSDAYRRVQDKVDTMLNRRVPGWKRALDIAGALTAVTLLSPLFLLVSAYIKIVSPGPVLFRQARVGYGGRLFIFLKFRTMRVDNDESGHREHLKQLIHSQAAMVKLDAADDPRIIPGAKILRRACVDELPQLFNVLKGEMSLVGPRPCLPYEAEEYQRWHAGRFDVLPGMTGLWQVSGKNNLSFQTMIRLDIAYSTSLSLFNDLRILLRTGPAIVGYVLEAVRRRLGAGAVDASAEGGADSTAAR
ncbi:MAG: sugar transferase, partial [Spirochaetales bacterium]|nr:sugar transferase [Spirochaetales bacterium]